MRACLVALQIAHRWCAGVLDLLECCCCCCAAVFVTLEEKYGEWVRCGRVGALGRVRVCRLLAMHYWQA